MRLAGLLSAVLLLAACGGSDPPMSNRTDRIVVDHILIGVRSARFPQGKRSEADARAFARELLAKVEADPDAWAAAKRDHSEDPPPGGPYGLADHGVPPAPGESPRNEMVPAFGDVGFSLAVGEVGLAEYDARKSPFGFHLIKRVK